MLDLYGQSVTNDRLFKISCRMPWGVEANLHPNFGNNTEIFNRLAVGNRSKFVFLGMLLFM